MNTQSILSRDSQKRDNSQRITKFTTDQSIFEWSNVRWQSCMEGGRLIHPDYPYQWYDKDQIRIEDNNIISLSLSHEPAVIHHWNGKTYLSDEAVSVMRSVDTFKYGTFRLKIKLPKGKSLWPSFWLCGVGRWPENGEIDGCEAWNDNNSYFKLFRAQPPYLYPSWRTTTNVHYRTENLSHDSIGSRNVSICKQHKNPAENWIEYEINWLPDCITILTNGVIVRQDEFSAKMIAKYAGRSNSGRRIDSPLMRVIINLWCESSELVELYEPMKIKDFEYIPINNN